MRRAARTAGGDHTLNREQLREFAAVAAACEKYRAALIVLLAGVLLLVSGGRGAKSEPVQTETDGFSLSAFGNAALRPPVRNRGRGAGGADAVARTDRRGGLRGQHAREQRRVRKPGARRCRSCPRPATARRPSRSRTSCRPSGARSCCATGRRTRRCRLAVTQAVGAVCGLSSDRITVLKRASGA